MLKKHELPSITHEFYHEFFLPFCECLGTFSCFAVRQGFFYPLLASLSVVVSYSLPTSNHNLVKFIDAVLPVVSYSLPTSNHNLLLRTPMFRLVVSYSLPTSNHNSRLDGLLNHLVVSYSLPTSNHNQIR